MLMHEAPKIGPDMCKKKMLNVSNLKLFWSNLQTPVFIIKFFKKLFLSYKFFFDVSWHWFTTLSYKSSCSNMVFLESCDL